MTSQNLASARRYFAGAVIGLALLGTAGTAGAASVDLGTVNADPSTGSGGSFSFGGNDYQFFNVFINVDPFTIDSGDDVTVHVHMTPTALTIPSGFNQFVGLNFEPRDGIGASNINNTGTMEFANGSGGPNGAGPQTTGFPAFSNVWGQSGSPAAAFTIVDLFSFAIYNWDGPAQTFSQISVSYQVDNPVPVPAALPLFASGLGVLGFLARRRRKAAA